MDTRKFAMNYGAVLGLWLAFFGLLLFGLGIDEQQSVIPSILNNVFIIGFLVYAIIQYRDNINHGSISYSKSLKLGTSVAFFSSVIMAFYTLIYMTYLNPEMLADIMNMTEQAMLEADPEISDEELDLALSMTSKFLQPHWMMIMGVLGGTFTGFLYSLVISLFTKKEIQSGVAEAVLSEENSKEHLTQSKDNLEILANREFQNKNFIGTKTTWKFNKDGSKVHVKAGWLGINTVNATIAIESLGNGVFLSKGFISQKFTVEGNRIKSGPAVLIEIQ